MDEPYKLLKKIISEILEVEENIIDSNSSPENIDSWDSYNGLAIVTALENSFKIEFTIDEIVSVKKVKDIIFYLRKHGIEINEI